VVTIEKRDFSETFIYDLCITTEQKHKNLFKMEKQILKKVIEEQRNRILAREFGIKRGILSKLLDKLKLKEVVVISGVRRSGKSFLLNQIIKSLKNKAFLYINFEDERLDGFTLKDFNKLWGEFLALYKPDGEIFAFVDEIQEIKGWEKWVNRMYEFEKVRFFITGSNARLLSSEISTLLTGRNITYELYPLSFKEIVKTNNLKLSYDTKETAKINALFNDYLEYGGFPAVWLEQEKELLLGYYNDIINRDITERYKIKNKKLFREFVRYALSCYGRYITFHKLKNVFDLKSVNTAKKYFGFAEEAFLVFSLESYSSAMAEVVKAPRKCFVVDHGMADYLSLKSGKDIGLKYENIVFVELKRKQIVNPKTEIYYWKNPQGYEVDFVVKEDLKVKQLIQVCYNPNDYDTKKRELRALIKASNKLKCKDLLVITEDKEGKEKVKNQKIRYIPLWKWLLV